MVGRGWGTYPGIGSHCVCFAASLPPKLTPTQVHTTDESACPCEPKTSDATSKDRKGPGTSWSGDDNAGHTDMSLWLFHGFVRWDKERFQSLKHTRPMSLMNSSYKRLDDSTLSPTLTSNSWGTGTVAQSSTAMPAFHMGSSLSPG